MSSTSRLSLCHCLHGQIRMKYRAGSLNKLALMLSRRDEIVSLMGPFNIAQAMMYKVPERLHHSVSKSEGCSLKPDGQKLSERGGMKSKGRMKNWAVRDSPAILHQTQTRRREGEKSHMHINKLTRTCKEQLRAGVKAVNPSAGSEPTLTWDSRVAP